MMFPLPTITTPPAAASLLLDTYTGAAAAYSVRLIRGSYAGSCLRVRRSSDNTESDIGFVSGYIDTATLATFCSGTDGFVTVWYDQSGNGNNATQTTAANQPKIVSSGTVITDTGGNPAMTFDGTNDGFVFSSISGTAPWSAFGVFSRPSTGVDTAGFGAASAPGALSGVHVPIGINFYTQTTVAYSQYSATGTRMLIASIAHGALQDVYKNGAQLTPNLSNVSAAGGANFTTFGGPVYYHTGNWQEAILWSSDQSANQAAIAANMNAYFTIY